MRLTRRLTVVRLLSLSTVCACSAGLAQEPGPLSGARLFGDVQRYYDLGEHRAGSEGDKQTAEWLAAALGEAGFDTELQSWTLTRFDLRTCDLTVDGKQIESYPFWFPRTTGADTVRGELVELTLDTPWDLLAGRVAVVDSATAGRRIYNNGVNSWIEQAANAGAAGLIVVVPSEAQELAAINAREPYVRDPLPIPAVIVPASAESDLKAAMTRHARASVRIDGTAVADAVAHNVIARIDRGGKWVVVTTPTSGWFRCAGERGPGVALFLGLARWAASRDAKLSYLFIGNSGHELDNLGAHHSMDAFAPKVDDVACWIHLGASIGTRVWKKTDSRSEATPEPNPAGNLVSAPGLLPALEASFKNVPWLKPRSQGPVLGELRHFINAGYPAFGFFGGHFYFHTRLDTPECTSPELLEPVGSALETFLATLERASE